jgi:predicted dinucleotide-binding enzyme
MGKESVIMAQQRRLAPTRVGILGSGEVGRRLAEGFSSRGHEVVIGTRAGAADRLADWPGTAGPRITAGTFAEAAGRGQIVVLAVLGTAAESAIDLAGPEALAEKVVIDATNPLDLSGGFPPKLAWGHTDSGGERAQRAAPQARVVKCFNTVGNALFVDPNFRTGQPTMFLAGNDESAKRVVVDLLYDFGWTSTADCGGIESARLLEPLCVLWLHLLDPSRKHAFSLLSEPVSG